ncbi:MAG: NosD domain-containing protein [Candidatus Hodarchaeota archaeon]
MPHDPIAINGNEDFLTQASNESWPGEGTITNPIIIENYNITSPSTEHMITIWNTDLWFIIQGCILNGVDGLSKTYGDGIWLNSIKNGIIKNNTIFSNKMGISLEPNNENVVIEGNKIYNNAASGIHSHQSRNITIFNNNISKNIQGGTDYISQGDGIELSESNILQILDNNIHYNDHNGITIRSSQNINCTSNKIYNNTLGISLSTSSKKNNFTLNVIANHTDYALTLTSSCTMNIVQFNDFATNSVLHSSQAKDDGLYNIFVFNYWNEWVEPDIDNNTIVDNAYLIDGQTENSDQNALTRSVFTINNLNSYTTNIVFPMMTSSTTNSGLISTSISDATTSSTDLASEYFLFCMIITSGIYSLHRRKKII